MLLFVALIPGYQAIAQKTPDKERRDVLTASATWVLGVDDNGLEKTMDIFVDKSRIGVDIFLRMSTDSGSELFGRYFTTDGSVFSIRNNLEEAVLKPVTIDACPFDQLDEDGHCTGGLDTLQIEVNWIALGTKATSYEKFQRTVADRQMTLYNSVSRDASASGSVNEVDLDNSLFAYMSTSKLLATNFGEPNKPPRLDQYGNKGGISAHANWVETSLNGELASVVIKADQEIKGNTSIGLIVIFIRDDGTREAFQGERIIPAGTQENVFTMDMRDASAKLDPVAITVCDFDLAGQCSGAPSAITYTVEAQWDGVDETAQSLKITQKSNTGDSKSTVTTDGVVMGADATGSIDGNGLGDVANAELFHVANVKVVFK